MLKYLLSFIAVISLFSSCKNNSTEYVPESSGNPYEIFIVATKEQWNSPAGDTLRNILQQDVQWLNQQEPMFDLKNVEPSFFTNLITKHRNTIMIRTGADFPKTTVGASYDVNAAPQIIVYMDSPNTDSLAAYLHQKRNEIVELMDMTEQSRFVARMKSYPAKDVNEEVAKTFGINISIPYGYKIRNKIGDNFMWISYEMPLSSQGLFIYSYPYDSTRTITAEYLTEMRNAFASNIPGPRENTYMTTSTAYPPEVKNEITNNRSWAVLRGFWDVYGDYMGGPFVSYSTLDKKNNRIFVIDEYVYSPKPSKGKRNYIKQLESIVKTISFPQ